MSFVAPATSSGDFVKVADLNGHLLIISPTEYKASVSTAMGDTEAIQCNIVDLDTNEEHTDVLLFNVALRSALKPNIGAQVLARIGQGIAKVGKSAPWILNDATVNPADIQKATAFLAAKATAGIVPPAATVTPAADINDPAIQALLAQLAK
jgi:hypothetical protein